MQTILIDEIDSIPRRSVSLAKEKSYSKDDQKTAQKCFYESIHEFLLNEQKILEMDHLFIFQNKGGKK